MNIDERLDRLEKALKAALDIQDMFVAMFLSRKLKPDDLLTLRDHIIKTQEILDTGKVNLWPTLVE
jgi:hypothetical protein